MVQQYSHMIRVSTPFEMGMAGQIDGIYQLCQLGLARIARFRRGEESKDQLLRCEGAYSHLPPKMREDGWSFEGYLDREEARRMASRIQEARIVSALMDPEVNTATLTLLAGYKDMAS